MSGDTFTVTAAPEIWERTSELRWYKAGQDAAPELQQAWFCRATGKFKRRAVTEATDEY